MEEIKSTYDVLYRLAWLTKKVQAIDSQQDQLEAERLHFSDLLQELHPQVGAILKANPTIQSISLNDEQVLVRQGPVDYEVRPVVGVFSLTDPPCSTPDTPPVPANHTTAMLGKIAHGELTIDSPAEVSPYTHAATRSGDGVGSLSMRQVDSLIDQDAHDRIQAGKPTPEDINVIALAHAWAEIFGDLEGEE